MAFDWVHPQVGPAERLLLVGTNPAAITLATELYDKPAIARRRDCRVHRSRPCRVGLPVLNPGVIGTVEEIPAIVRARSVDRVVVSLADARGKLPMDKLLEMKLDGVGFDHLASVYEQYTGKIAVENLRPSWLIFSQGFAKSETPALGKAIGRCRCVEPRACRDAAGPVLVGIRLVKAHRAVPLSTTRSALGSMGGSSASTSSARCTEMPRRRPARSGPSVDDPRVTRFGQFLRRTQARRAAAAVERARRRDEPGGAEARTSRVRRELTEAIPFYSLRHAVRPGVTGWAQVRYTYGANVEDALEKLQYDLFYIKHLSIRFDLTISVCRRSRPSCMARGAR